MNADVGGGTPGCERKAGDSPVGAHNQAGGVVENVYAHVFRLFGPPSFCDPDMLTLAVISVTDPNMRRTGGSYGRRSTGGSGRFGSSGLLM
jgi:hypothetical protein